MEVIINSILTYKQITSKKMEQIYLFLQKGAIKNYIISMMAICHTMLG